MLGWSQKLGVKLAHWNDQKSEAGCSSFQPLKFKRDIPIFPYFCNIISRMWFSLYAIFLVPPDKEMSLFLSSIFERNSWNSNPSCLIKINIHSSNFPKPNHDAERVCPLYPKKFRYINSLLDHIRLSFNFNCAPTSASWEHLLLDGHSPDLSSKQQKPQAAP